MRPSLARRGSSGDDATARNLFEKYPFIGAVQIPLGKERGFIRVYEDGDVDFHLEGDTDEEVFPGFQEPEGIRFNALDAPIFRFITEVLESARAALDEQAETAKRGRAEAEPEEPAPPSKPAQPQIISGPGVTPELNNFALK
jgi:hypothetical protein